MEVKDTEEAEAEINQLVDNKKSKYPEILEKIENELNSPDDALLIRGIWANPGGIRSLIKRRFNGKYKVHQQLVEHRSDGDPGPSTANKYNLLIKFNEE